jgi:hypothetical protein
MIRLPLDMSCTFIMLLLRWMVSPRALGVKPVGVIWPNLFGVMQGPVQGKAGPVNSHQKALCNVMPTRWRPIAQSWFKLYMCVG